MGKKGAKGPAPTFRSRTTRSSKGRLLSLPSKDASSDLNASLTHQLQLLGLYAAPTLGDGNCLFRALSDQIYGTPEKHAQVRREVCDWIEKYGERYEGFVEGDGSGDDGDGGRGRRRREKEKTKETGKGKALEVYLRNMRENATYGGHMELSAFAHMTRRNVKVIQPGLVYVIEWDAWGGFEEDEGGVQQAPSSSKATTSTSQSNYAKYGDDEESDLTESDESDDEDYDNDERDDDAVTVSKRAQSATLGGTGLDSLSSLSSISTTSTSASIVTVSMGASAPLSTASTSTSASVSTVSSSATPRRPTRSSLPHSMSSDAGRGVKDKDKGKVDVGKEKIKIGKGYYYLEEVTSDEEDNEGDEEVRRMVGMDVGEEQSVDGVKVGDEALAHRVEGMPKIEVKMEVDGDAKEKERRNEKERKEKKEKRERVVEKEKSVEVSQPPKSKRESGGPTVYVAYHDWEHFSSIRNLRGPHVGLPNVQEMPAQGPMNAIDEDMEAEQQVHSMTPKERERERKREERKEKERKDAERRKKKEERRAKEREERAMEIAREKERMASGSGVKIMLKLPRSGTASMSGTTTPAVQPESNKVGVPGSDDPSLVPLPASRAMTPLGTVVGVAGGGVSHTPNQDVDLSITPTSSTHPVQPSQPLPTPIPHLGSTSLPRASTPHLVADRTQYRSPKRSFDESSASGGEDASGREGREGMKRSRRVVEEILGANLDMDVDVDVDGDGDGEGADTPGLSAPGSSSSASETSSEVASEVSEGPGFVSVPPSSTTVEGHGKDATITSLDDVSITTGAKPMSSVTLPDSPLRKKEQMQSPKSARKQHPYGGEKQLTRRERKALGLPKYGGSDPSLAVSAGKIVIPGGRFKGRMAAQAAANARAAAAVAGGGGAGVRVGGGEGGEDSEEWRRNGTGRLDVRGFRELKI